MQARRMIMLVIVGLGLGVPQLMPRAATAQIDSPHVTFSPYVGWVFWGENLNQEDQVVYGGRLGLMLNSYVGVEGTLGFMSGETIDGPWVYPRPRLVGPVEEDIRHNALDLILQAGSGTFRPYIIGGWQHLIFENDDVSWDRTTFHGWEFGGGLKMQIVPRMDLRLDARDVFFTFDDFPPDSPDGRNHNIFVTGGLTLAFGGSAGDDDEDDDGVDDEADLCPATPVGVRVDAKGCPIDGDGDGVPDGIDQCASTPAGATVDASGCPSDSDGDGVPDGIDLCANTAAGVNVDAKGCAGDSDGDGVPDGTDRCANTPSGAKVDATGCPTDSDGDGVSDGLDRCPSTPAGAKVDKDGCPIEITEREVELLDTGKITVRNVHFETNKWDILPGSYPVLDEIGGILVKWPQLRIEVGGHADHRGTDQYNLELSDKRAHAVLDYLLSKFPQIDRNQYTAVGYGESQPVASNETADGMAQNRRVEFKVLNTEELKKERERRRMLQEGD